MNILVKDINTLIEAKAKYIETLQTNQIKEELLKAQIKENTEQNSMKSMIEKIKADILQRKIVIKNKLAASIELKEASASSLLNFSIISHAISAPNDKSLTLLKQLHIKYHEIICKNCKKTQNFCSLCDNPNINI